MCALFMCFLSICDCWGWITEEEATVVCGLDRREEVGEWVVCVAEQGQWVRLSEGGWAGCRVYHTRLVAHLKEHIAGTVAFQKLSAEEHMAAAQWIGAHRRPPPPGTTETVTPHNKI